jgi:glucosamine-6-phosphate deaminase
MKVIVTDSFDESCELVAAMMVDQVKTNPTTKFGLATGGTAEKVYPHLVNAYKAGCVSFSQISSVNLDEYIGISADHQQSYRRCMDDWFFSVTDVNKTKTYVACGSNPIDDEIRTFSEKLYGDKLVDFQLLGVGVNGHIGFNEPNDYLVAGVHIETLDNATIDANSRYFDSKAEVPRESITMGVGDILKAKRIVLIATGDNKASVMKKLLSDDTITTQVPVTILKAHSDVTVVIDKALAKSADYPFE